MTDAVKTCGCGCTEEPTEEELLARLDAVIAEYRGKPGALIPVLQLAQGIFGYLPEVALKHIARELRKPYSEVAGVVGFYSFFTTVPRGRHLIRICMGTACYVRGGVRVIEPSRRSSASTSAAPPRIASSLWRSTLLRRLRSRPGDHRRRRRPPPCEAQARQRILAQYAEEPVRPKGAHDMADKIASPDQLKALAQKAKADIDLRQGRKETQVHGAHGHLRHRRRRARDRGCLPHRVGGAGVTSVSLHQTGCAGLCEQEPMATVTMRAGGTMYRYGLLSYREQGAGRRGRTIWWGGTPVCRVPDQELEEGEWTSDLWKLTLNKKAHFSLICTGGGCIASGALEASAAMRAELVRREPSADEIEVIETGCLGPVVQGPGGARVPSTASFYQNVQVADVPEIVEEHLLKGRLVARSGEPRRRAPRRLRPR